MLSGIRWETERAPEASIRVEHSDPFAVKKLADCLAANLMAQPSGHCPVVVLCIGTDRSTGDALGPLVGTRLSGARLRGLEVLGTLDEPVHAANLADTVAELNRRHAGALVIAVDACLGQNDQVGTLAFATGPVRPGAGVNKVLPAVGQMHITGTVNVGGFMEYIVLQNTRLSLVFRMAGVIAESICEAVRTVQLKKEATSRLPESVIAE